MNSNIIFKQLFDPDSSTYTYLLADSKTKDGIIIDPVLEQVERDLSEIQKNEINLRWILETHVHADHATGSYELKLKTGAKSCAGASTRLECADRLLKDGEELIMGSVRLKTIFTPGHTNGCTSYFIAGRVFTGDALLIQGCGRTDFQEGSSKTLFHSVREKLFQLPDETLVYPAHDYKGRKSSTIGEEKQSNPRLKLSNSESEFIRIMAELKLDAPKHMERAVPINLRCGKIA